MNQTFASNNIRHKDNYNNGWNRSMALKRLKTISRIYKLYINQNSIKRKNIQISFYDFINDELSNRYNFDNLLQDFKYITKNKHLLIQDELNGDSEYNCRAENCYMVNRIERDRSSINSIKNGQFARLFFIDGQGDDNKNEPDDDAIYRNVCCQEIMDSIHMFLYHTIRINEKEIESKRSELELAERKAESKDNDDGCIN